MQEFNTERFVLRHLDKSDKRFYCDLYLNQSLMQLVGSYSNREKLEKSFETCRKLNKKSSFQRLTYCIFDDNKPIGITSLVRSKLFPSHAEIGTIVVSDMQSRRVAFEVMKKLINFALSELKLTRVYSEYLSKNTAAMKLVQNLSFTIEELDNGMCYCFQENIIP